MSLRPPLRLNWVARRPHILFESMACSSGGLKVKQLSPQQRELVSSLAKRLGAITGIKAVVLGGSHARGRAQPGSDIDLYRSEPFFVYYPLVLPHDPWIEPPGYQRGSGPENEERQRKFAAMVAYVDKMVGRVNDQLNRLGLSEKTMVIFTGDNGTNRELISNLKGQVVRGDKGHPTDAGTHVPLVIKWKDVIPAGTTRDDLIDFTDFLPTLSAITNAMLPSGVVIDGKSFAPQLRGQKGSPREWVFCHYDPKWADFKFSRHAQDKRYKLYHDGSFFDYRHDPLEKSLIAKRSITSEQLKARDKLQHVLDSLK